MNIKRPIGHNNWDIDLCVPLASEGLNIIYSPHCLELYRTHPLFHLAFIAWIVILLQKEEGKTHFCGPNDKPSILLQKEGITHFCDPSDQPCILLQKRGGYNTVCSVYNFSLMNEYPNTFVTANYS